MDEQEASEPLRCAYCGSTTSMIAGHNGRYLCSPSCVGSGDFSIGSRVWPGTSKLLEEMGELQQVIGKLIAVAGSAQHWDGDLRAKLVDELADVTAALRFFGTENLTLDEIKRFSERVDMKLARFREWHQNPAPPPPKESP
jgi:NTP pyrophosphatase (non-canonical NTP hydrolase)